MDWLVHLLFGHDWAWSQGWSLFGLAGLVALGWWGRAWVAAARAWWRHRRVTGPGRAALLARIAWAWVRR
jgi:hypothetical protein